LEDLRVSELARIRAVALDVDGTLAGADHAVSDRATAVLHEVQSAGLAVIIVTGRARQNTLDIARAAGLLSSVVSCNGSVVTDLVTDEDLRIRTMHMADIAAMVELHDRLDLTLTWWTSRTLHISEAGPAQTLLADLNQQPVLVGDPAAISGDSIVKMMLHGKPEALEAAEPEIRFRIERVARSMAAFLELTAEEGTKWHGLRFALGRLGIAPEECMGIGDGGNDVHWLSRIGYPVAMANARSEVHDVAIRTIGHHAKDAVAAFLDEALLNGLGQAG
jgi:Cof subfamily protein (haloacid dehalogenase superfamily)